MSRADGQKNGVGAEAARAAAGLGRKTMSAQEARQILGLPDDASLDDVTKKYAHLFEANEKSGTFYLQSKVHRAKEALETELRGGGGGTDSAGTVVGEGGASPLSSSSTSSSHSASGGQT